MPCFPRTDPLTDLETRESAERAITAAIEQDRPEYVALFAVDRLHLRWRGPALVGVLDRFESASAVQEEISRITSMKLEATVQIGNGSVLLPIASISLLMPPKQTADLAELTQRFDAYIGEQARH